MGKEKILFNWSSGKDSALALYRLMLDNELDVSLLLTTVSRKYKRVSQHGVRNELLEQQVKSIGISLKKVWLPCNLDMDTYSSIMHESLQEIKRQGITTAAFGDIFLEDLRNYRMEQLSSAGFSTLFPLWKNDTQTLAEEFLESGFRAKVVCVNGNYLDQSFVGREFDHSFLDDLPPGTDYCGENGEFHTFVYDGPIFSRKIRLKRAEVVHRIQSEPGSTHDANSNICSPLQQSKNKGLWFCDFKGYADRQLDSSI